MIIKNGKTISFEWEEDYTFLSFFDRLVRDYCKDNNELKKKIMMNFFKAFEQEE
jgi:hypothetical protein